MRRLGTRTAAGLLALVALGGCGPRRARHPGAPPISKDSLSGPHFAFGKATLTPEGEAKVWAVAANLNRYPNRPVEVNGYTDAVGTDTRNERLSERRAEAVRDALVRYGVSASRITIRGYGDANPVASNATAEGRAQNRRVEIILE